jgi:predicted transcriptional regulator
MTDTELTEIITNHDDRAVTASEVADAANMTNAGVLKRLNDLAQRGIVSKKEVGSRAVVWWVSDGYSSAARSSPAGDSQ